MRYFFVSLFIGLSLQSSFAHCHAFSIQLYVSESANFSQTNLEYDVRIVTLRERGPLCDDFGRWKFKVFSSCEYEEHFAFLQSQVPFDSTSQNCFPISEVAGTHTYFGKTLNREVFEGVINLDSFSCNDIRVQIDRGSGYYSNIYLGDSLGVRMATSVSFHKGWPLRNTAYVDSSLSVFEACLGKRHFVRPFIRTHDSIIIRVVKPHWYYEYQGTIGRNEKDFKPGLSTNKPIVSSSFTPIDFNTAFDFTPTDTGLMVIPLEMTEWAIDTVFHLWYRKAITYWQMPVYVSDSCIFSSSQSSSAFATDTIQHSCGDSLLVPFKTSVASHFVSPDGSDFKFHHPQGFPSIVKSAEAVGRGVYADTVMLDVQFLKDGIYEMRVVNGNDGNSLLSQCGDQVPSYQKVFIQVSGCSQVGMDEEGFKRLSLYPNPAQDVIRLSANESFFRDIKEVEIFSTVGEKLLSRKIRDGEELSEVQIDISSLTSGVYFLRLGGEMMSFVKE